MLFAQNLYIARHVLPFETYSGSAAFSWEHRALKAKSGPVGMALCCSKSLVLFRLVALGMQAM